MGLRRLRRWRLGAVSILYGIIVQAIDPVAKTATFAIGSMDGGNWGGALSTYVLDCSTQTGFFPTTCGGVREIAMCLPGAGPFPSVRSVIDSIVLAWGLPEGTARAALRAWAAAV